MHYEPKCPHGHVAKSICISKDCENQNCFCCDVCKRIHPVTCEYMLYKKFVHALHKQQGLNKKQIMTYQDKVQRIFKQLIKTLQAQFLVFRQQFQRYNATQYTLQFYDKIRQHKQKQLNGKFASYLLTQKQPKMINYKMRHQLQMKQMRNQILAIQDVLIKKVRPFYKLSDHFQESDIQFPQINELKQIQERFKDRKNMSTGLLKQHYKVFQKLAQKDVYNFQLLWRASQNQFSCQSFHQRCDGKNNTLVMAKTQFGKVIGLWCPFVWDSPSNWRYLNDTKGAFMFSLTPALYDLKFTPVKKQFAIGLHKDYGPIFGDDFVIYDKAHHSRSCWSNFPDVYNCKQKTLQNNAKVIKDFIGNKDQLSKFNLQQWEVYKVSFGREDQLDKSWMKQYQKI